MAYMPVWMSAGRSSSIRNWLNWKSMLGPSFTVVEMR